MSLLGLVYFFESLAQIKKIKLGESCLSRKASAIDCLVRLKNKQWLHKKVLIDAATFRRMNKVLQHLALAENNNRSSSTKSIAAK